MLQLNRQRFGICCGPLALAVVDAVVTLSGQTADYWAGAFGQAHEFNPLAYWLLALHPGAFVVGFAAWMIAVVLGILMLPREWARVFALAVMISHAIAASTWLFRWSYGYVAVIALFGLAWCFDRLIWRKS